MRRPWAEITLSSDVSLGRRTPGTGRLRSISSRERNKVHNYRKDTKLLKEIDDMLQKGMSTDRVYNNIAKKKEQTMSETVTGPKVIVIGSMPQRKPM